MNPENKHVTTNEIEQVPTSPMPADRAVVALVRVGTRRCRLAAAFMAVVVGLASQIGIQSVAQAKQSTLYLDAPVVSTERASKAGDTASAYSTSDSPVSSEILAWLGVPARSFHVSQSSGGAEKAFSSITAPDGEEAGGVTIAAALRAGQVMLAQIGGSPSEDGGAESSSPGAIRPQLGDDKAEPEPDSPEDAREEHPTGADSTSDAGGQAYVSAPVTSASGGEPSGGARIVIPTPTDEEALAEESQQAPPAGVVSAPSDTGATPSPESEMGEEPYGPTGPVANVGEAPASAATGSLEDGDDGSEQPSPDGGVPASEPNAVPGAGGGEPAETEPSVEETGPTSGEGGRSVLVPVSPPSVEEETTTTQENNEPASTVPPTDADGSDPASEEPPPEGTSEDASAGTDIPSTTSTGPFADEPSGEYVQIVVVVEEAPQTETPAKTPEQPTTEHPPAGQARPEDVSPSEAPSVREPSDGEAPSEGSMPQDGGTEQGQSPPEETPLEEEPVEQPPAREESVVEQPGDVPPEEEQPPAEDESPSTGGTGARDDAPVAPPEDLRPGGERPEAQEGVADPPPGGALSENPNDMSQEDVAPPPDDQASDNPREGGRDERQEEDLQKEDGLQVAEGAPEAFPSNAGEQVEENGGGGASVQERPRDSTIAPEQGGAIQQEQTVIVEVGGDSSPEPPAQDALPTTEEPSAAEPVPQAVQAPTPTRTEEPAARQHEAEQAQADRRSTPEPVTVDQAPTSEDADGSPEGNSGRRGGSS